MTLPDDAACYEALKSRDARFDGRIFVGVASTRIYCRPVCGVRTPLRANCSFHRSAAAAEAAGFRPCLRCRPELAPGFAAVDAPARLARRAAGLIDDGALADGGVEALAARLGVTSRHLRRVFDEAYGVSPIDWAQTQRLLLAKRLLTDTAMPVTEVAMASGFGSLRRFNALFLARYRLAPSQLRTRAEPGGRTELRFLLAFRPPYDWEWVLGFLARRTIKGVESVEDGVYRRVVALGNDDTHAGHDATGPVCTGWIEVRPLPGKHLLEVRMSPSLAGAVPSVLARVKRVFDTEARPDEIAAVLGDLGAAHPGIRLPGGFDGFELAARAILGQQVSVKAAHTLAGRIAERFGTPVATPFQALTCAFPSAPALAAQPPEEIARLGIVGQRARALVALAAAVTQRRLMLDPSCDVESALAALRALPGIGDWTAQYVAMRALGWPDAFPASDLILMRALGVRSPKAADAIAQAWRPWRGYAVMHLWSGARPAGAAGSD